MACASSASRRRPRPRSSATSSPPSRSSAWAGSARARTRSITCGAATSRRSPSRRSTGWRRGRHRRPRPAARDYARLVAEVMSRIQDPTPPETGQSYSFILDADVRSAPATSTTTRVTVRRSFETTRGSSALPLRRSPRCGASWPAETERGSLERFMEILLVMLNDAGGGVSPTSLAPVFESLLEGYWQAGDGSGLRAFARCGWMPPLTRRSIRQPRGGTQHRRGVPEPGADRRDDPEGRGNQPVSGRRDLDLEPRRHRIWDLLIDFTSSLPEGETRAGVVKHLRGWLATEPDLLRRPSRPWRRRSGRGLAPSMKAAEVRFVHARSPRPVASHRSSARSGS